MSDTTELLSRLRVGALTLKSLPKDGQRLIIDDSEASHIAAAIDEAVELLTPKTK